MQGDLVRLLFVETGKTLYMVGVAFVLACVLGGGLGVTLFYFSPGSLSPRQGVYTVISMLLSFLTAIPFAILIVLLFPLTRLLVGTSLGATASIVPLTVGTIPFVASLISESLQCAGRTYLEPAIALGIPRRKIIQDILFPEKYPQMIFSLKNVIVHLIACSTLAGFVGGGGLGQILLQYGYYRFDWKITIAVLVITLFFIECIRIFGDILGRNILKRRGLL